MSNILEALSGTPIHHEIRGKEYKVYPLGLMAISKVKSVALEVVKAVSDLKTEVHLGDSEHVTEENNLFGGESEEGIQQGASVNKHYVVSASKSDPELVDKALEIKRQALDQILNGLLGKEAQEALFYIIRKSYKDDFKGVNIDAEQFCETCCLEFAWEALKGIYEANRDSLSPLVQPLLGISKILTQKFQEEAKNAVTPKTGKEDSTISGEESN